MTRASIVHVIDSLGRGGAERVVVTLSLGQLRRGHQVTVISLFEPNDLAAELEASGVRTVCLRLKEPKNLFSSGLCVDQELRKAGANFVVAHLGYSMLAVAAARRIPGQVRLGVFHNLGITGSVAFRLALAFAVRQRLDSTVGVSLAAAKAYQSNLWLPDLPHVIYNPVDFASIRAMVPATKLDARVALSIAGDERLVVSIARLSHEKGLDVLLYALAGIPIADRPRLVVAGSGPSADALRTLATALDLDVTWLGQIHAEQAMMWLKASDALVLPSRTEALGMVILEAIAVKTCVIATRVGGIPECIGEDEGWLVHPNSTQALAEAVLAAMKSGPTRFERAEKALESAERKFAVETILSKWDEEFSLKSSHRG